MHHQTTTKSSIPKRKPEVSAKSQNQNQQPVIANETNKTTKTLSFHQPTTKSLITQSQPLAKSNTKTNTSINTQPTSKQPTKTQSNQIKQQLKPTSNNKLHKSTYIINTTQNNINHNQTPSKRQTIYNNQINQTLTTTTKSIQKTQTQTKTRKSTLQQTNLQTITSTIQNQETKH